MNILNIFYFNFLRTSASNVPMFIDPKSRKVPQSTKYPNVYDLNSETKVSSCKCYEFVISCLFYVSIVNGI